MLVTRAICIHKELVFMKVSSRILTFVFFVIFVQDMAEPSELDQLSSNARAKLQHRNLPRHVILHNSKFKATWDWFVLALVIYTAIEIPFTVAFIGGSGRMSPFEQLQKGHYMAIANFIVDLMFIVDIFINFRSTYTRKGTDELIVDPRMIACNYLQTWFVIDLLAAIPFEFFVTEEVRLN